MPTAALAPDPPHVSDELDPDSLRVVYEQICREHGVIADFRAKLLALLPIASGGGLLLLEGRFDAAPAPVVTAVGLLGVCVVTGLFLYELRGGHRCRALSLCAAELEQHFLGPYQNHGVFSYMGEPRGVGLATNTWAALVIYPAMIASWAFVAAVGLGGGVAGYPHLVLAAAVGLLASLAGMLANTRAERQRHEDHERCPYVGQCLGAGRRV